MIVAGFGFRAGASIESLQDALSRTSSNLLPDAIATIEDKADQLAPLAAKLDVPLLRIAAAKIERQETKTASDASMASRSVGSMAEASALAGVGATAKLLAPRVISQDRMATCALAKGEVQ
ncbi:MAG: precorrin methylase [Boseongicola sp.]|nr:MAG: precorrin methylase [Boseongicola sp.]